MPLIKLNKKKYVTDKEFDTMFPNKFRGVLSDDHWTPVHIAIETSLWLSGVSDKICDLGCGIGKFCLIGAVLTEAHYTGIDYRKSLITSARKITDNYKLSKKINFINQDFYNVDLSCYNGFYFYNPYLEHILKVPSISNEIETSVLNVKMYTEYLKCFFSKAEHHISIVTYDNIFPIIPMEKFKLKKVNNDLRLYQNF